MTAERTEETRRSVPTRAVVAALAAAAGVVFLVVGLASLLLQVEVTDPAVATTRSCGSAFDGVVDRAGWETWWAADLAEPDDGVRAALVRTNGCPGAVNTRIVVGLIVIGLALASAVVAVVLGRRRSAVGDAAAGGRRIRRVGRTTMTVGAILTATGLVALVVLLADSDNTLFLYTERVVVALAGVIVLVPAIALTVAGWVIVQLGRPEGHRDGTR